VAAVRTAGIAGNQRYPADLMLDNLLVAAHVTPAAWRHGTKKLLYLGSSCVYPRNAPQPYKPDALWTGSVESTSAAYATAKLAGVRLCEAYRQQHGVQFMSAVAADVFGPGDDFSADGNGHVVSALLSRMHAARVTGARSVTIWGSGAPRREFLYVDDLADAVLFLMRVYEDGGLINIGTGVTTSIRELADIEREIVGFDGDLVFDAERPDGAPLKGLDSAALGALGWKPSWPLRAALQSTYEWFLEHEASQVL
jgi:GDP-L-fucose synthase